MGSMKLQSETTRFVTQDTFVLYIYQGVYVLCAVMHIPCFFFFSSPRRILVKVHTVYLHYHHHVGSTPYCIQRICTSTEFTVQCTQGRGVTMNRAARGSTTDIQALYIYYAIAHCYMHPARGLPQLPSLRHPRTDVSQGGLRPRHPTTVQQGQQRVRWLLDSARRE